MTPRHNGYQATCYSGYHDTGEAVIAATTAQLLWHGYHNGCYTTCYNGWYDMNTMPPSITTIMPDGYHSNDGNGFQVVLDEHGRGYV